MDYVYNLFDGFKYYYDTINAAALSGAIDVIVVEQPDGTYLSTPFHVCFGKFAVFNIDEKFVDIQINNKIVGGIRMKLADNGVAFFFDQNQQSLYKGTFLLQGHQLKSLGLQHGKNNARFSISSKIQGTAVSECNIYLYYWSERIVISDIDGTITKSDVLGHIIPAIGGTWAHTNIVDLYRRIQNNGYQIVYLSSRAIGQSYQTKRYLESVIQNSKTLPDGPILLSPASILVAFHKEVIERRPEEFKIACLTDLRSLFPVKHPFYAGFGNRGTDIKSYVAVGIPIERILIIDSSGKVRNVAQAVFSTNYDIMLKDNIVDCLFPPLTSSSQTKNLEDEAKNSSFPYWHNKTDDVDDSEFERYECKRQHKQEENAKKKK